MLPDVDHREIAQHHQVELYPNARAPSSPEYRLVPKAERDKFRPNEVVLVMVSELEIPPANVLPEFSATNFDFGSAFISYSINPRSS